MPATNCLISRPLLLLSAFLICCHLNVVLAESPTSMFVFGDSFADTGNHDDQQAVLNIPWTSPYGMTSPGSPSGRYSDGQVLTDVVAGIANLNLPVNYRDKDTASQDGLQAGMNFAFGGSGVFETWGPEYTTFPDQISQLESLIQGGVYSQDNLGSALLLYILSGNDYAAYSTSPNSTNEGLLMLVPKVLTQVSVDLVRLYDLGFRKFGVQQLEPMGCLPSVTYGNGYSNCNEAFNLFAGYHNIMLAANVSTLSQTLPGSQFVLIDQLSSFKTVISGPSDYGFQEPLQPCCAPTSLGGACGVADSSGQPTYTVCSDATKNFWWDLNHPTDAAWAALTPFYKNMLQGVLA